MKERIVNVRPLFVIFVGIILGILTFYCGFNSVLIGKNLVVFIILLVVLFLACLLFVLSFIPKHKFYLLLKKFRYVVLSFIVSLLVGVLLLSFVFQHYRTMTFLHGKFSITGYVSECVIEDRDLKVVLSDCILTSDKNYDVNCLNITISDSDERIPIGTRISFSGKISTTKLFTDKNNIAKYYKDKVYNAVVSSSNISIGDNRGVSLVDKIREGIRSALEKNLNSENAGIAYAMLLGDKSGIDTENYNMFSYAGVSHILAVSGLHVGFLVALLVSILSLFKIKDNTILIIVSGLLAIYCILCKMSPSVVRASIMSIILLMSKCIGEEYDSLSSLSLAGTIILLINPAQLFDLGFQLSFLCVLSIITISKYVTEILVKIHLPKAFASLLSLSICINLAIYPLTTNVFESASILGVFTNLIIIPLFSIAFPILFVFAILSAIMPFLGFIMIVPQLLLHLIKLICTWVTNISFGNFIVFNWGYAVVFLTILTLLVIKFLMLKPRFKGVVLSVLLSTIIILVVVGQIPRMYRDDAILTWSQYETSSCVVVTDDNYKILVDYDEYSVGKALKGYKISKIDEWVYPTFDLTKIDEAKMIIDKYKIKKLILPDNPAFNDYSLAKLDNVDIIFVGEKEDFTNYSIRYFSNSDGRTYAVEIDTGKKILFDVSMTKGILEKFGQDITYDFCITKNDEYDIGAYITDITEIYSTTKIENENNVNSVKSIGQRSKYVIKL